MDNPNTKRKTPRRHLIFYLRVFDHDSGELLGYLGDLSTQGLMLVSEQAIKTDKVFALELHMRPQNETRREQETLIFNARSVWCRNDVNPEFFDTGFVLLDVADDILNKIEDLIEEVGFSG